MGRAPCCEKVGLKKGRWTAEEDDILLKYIQANGEGSWRSLPKNAGLLRCGKSCRLRWINYLRNDLKRGNISKQEEDLIIKLHASLGNKWSLIAAQLDGRTDNEIKNYWNSHLSRKIDTFRRPNSEPSLPIVLNLTPNAMKRKGGKTSRAAMKKNKMTYIKPTNKNIKSTKEMAQENESLNELRCPCLEAVGEERESGDLMLFDKIDDQKTSHELLRSSHHDQGPGSAPLSFDHDVNNICSCDQMVISTEDLESANLSSNGESGRGCGGSGGGEWLSCSSKASNLENGGIDWEWESFINENVWNNEQQQEQNQHQEGEMLSWLWDSDNIINGGGEIQDMGDGVQSENQEALVAWLFS